MTSHTGAEQVPGLLSLLRPGGGFSLLRIFHFYLFPRNPSSPLTRHKESLNSGFQEGLVNPSSALQNIPHLPTPLTNLLASPTSQLSDVRHYLGPS
jgi:hypothetical protein